MSKIRDFFADIDPNGRFFASFRDADGELNIKTGSIDDFGNVTFDEDTGAGWLILFCIIIAIPVFSAALNAAHNSVFAIAAIPHFITLLAAGHGIGLKPLLFWLGVPLVLSLLTFLTKRIGNHWTARLYPLWGLVAGILLLVYNTKVLGSTAYKLFPITTDLSLFTDALSRIVHVVIYVYLQTLAFNMVPALFSFSAAHFHTFGTTARRVIVGTILLHPIAQLFGRYHSYTPSAIYEGIAPLAEALQLTKGDLYVWCTQTSDVCRGLHGFHIFLIGLAVFAVMWIISWLITILMRLCKC